MPQTDKEYKAALNEINEMLKTATQEQAAQLHRQREALNREMARAAAKREREEQRELEDEFSQGFSDPFADFEEPQPDPLELNPMEDEAPEEDNPEYAVASYEAMHAGEKAPEETLTALSNAAMFYNKVDTYNSMYKTSINADAFAAELSLAWKMLSMGSKQGAKKLHALFEDTLRQAFEAESVASYEEWRSPDYTDIAKSTNELLRAGMFAHTDMYLSNTGARFFDETAFGGMSAREMAELTVNFGAWKGDQRSDEAWEKQSMDAINISIKWSESEKPYDVLLNNLRSVAASRDSADKRDIYNRLAAAELLLMSNEETMVPDPDNALKSVPDWNNRYWGALAKAREAVGIPPYISMREVIQGNYAGIQKLANNVPYNEKQNQEKLTSTAARAKHDVMETQVEEYTVLREGLTISDHGRAEREIEMTTDRTQISVKECDERRLMQQAPKSNPIQPQQAVQIELGPKA